MQLFSQTDVAYVVSKGHQTWILEGLDKRESLCQNRAGSDFPAPSTARGDKQKAKVRSVSTV